MRATKRGVAIGNQPLLSSDQIAGGRLETCDSRARVVIDGDRGRRATIDVSDFAEGTRLLQALQSEAIEETARFQVRPRTTFYLVSLVLCLLGFLIAGAQLSKPGLLWLPSLVLLFVVASYILNMANLVVGRDGVLISRVWKPRFIAYRDVDCVYRLARRSPFETQARIDYSGSALLTKKGDSIEFPKTKAIRTGAEFATAHERISHALATWRAGNSGTDVDALRRGTRSTKDWLATLRKMGANHQQVAYRAAPVERESLLMIADSPVNQAVYRATAALVLREQWTADERARLEVSAKAVADPRLREALDQVIAQKADDALEAVFDDLDPIAQRMPTRRRG